MRPLHVLAAVGISVALAASAEAAPSPTDVAVAQRAFDDARELFRTEHFEQACEKFSLSQRLDPKLGTLLNLAICHEKIGRYALATTEFHDARSLAAAENKPDRVDFADKRIAAIAPRLATLRIHVDPKNQAKLQVAIDGGAVGEAALESEIPVDAGTHHVTASATGGTAAPFEKDVDCRAGATCVVDLPPFVAVTGDGPPRSDSSHGGRIGGAVMLGVGGAALVVGGIFGALALSQRSKAEELCATGQCTAGQTENDRGVTFAWVSNVSLGVGAALALVGLVLVVVDPGHKGPVRASAGGLTLAF